MLLEPMGEGLNQRDEVLLFQKSSIRLSSQFDDRDRGFEVSLLEPVGEGMNETDEVLLFQESSIR